MVKQSGNQQQKPGPNRHLHARVGYLRRAAAYLTQAHPVAARSNGSLENPEASSSRNGSAAKGMEELMKVCTGPGQFLIAQARSVSRKAQIRLSPDAKRSMCKKCDAVLIPGQTSEEILENLSKGRSKPWANVLVIRCLVCGTSKRYPVGSKRQLRKSERETNTKSITNGKSKRAQQSIKFKSGLQSEELFTKLRGLTLFPPRFNGRPASSDLLSSCIVEPTTEI
ncbi:hypothetical protein FH972_021398 [Carpinus fangiana]|uniref:Rpr2-domain-containing protein n=1 Tax=Carpinus fangiana TaxID=176857 RepID=A0A5N6KPL4_9ROSI|nr:hypothetical protein FH972_021398 [Carpinus fangiana]